MVFSELTKLIQGTLTSTDVEFQHISIDSRTLKAGECFIAIRGPNFDGHNFLSQAKERGAVGAIVEREINEDFPQLLVADTQIALGQIAALRRQQVDIPIIAITGSCGKTTTKTMLAAILSESGKTLATEGNLNNNFGVPLTLMRLSNDDQYAVIEMGANHFGEIAYLTEICQPTIAVITHAGPVHLEGFVDLAGVARAKGEIFQGLNSEGIAVLNADNCYYDFWRKQNETRQVFTFGLENNAEVSATDIHFDESGLAACRIRTPKGDFSVKLTVCGRHNIVNALAATAAALAVDVSLAAIEKGLQSMVPIAKRLFKRSGIHGCCLIDDSYSANPHSLAAALEVLARCEGEKILILGDMEELGKDAKQYHHELGNLVRQSGVHYLYAIGDLTLSTIAAYGKGGEHFLDRKALLATVKQQLNPEVTVLIKGSNFNRMWEITHALSDPQEEKPCYSG